MYVSSITIQAVHSMNIFEKNIYHMKNSYKETLLIMSYSLFARDIRSGIRKWRKCKVHTVINASGLEACFMFYIVFMKRKFDVYLL